MGVSQVPRHVRATFQTCRRVDPVMAMVLFAPKADRTQRKISSGNLRITIVTGGGSNKSSVQHIYIYGNTYCVVLFLYLYFLHDEVLGG